MSLHLNLDYTVPKQTALVARAAFPKGTLCMLIYDELGTIFRDEDFADLFPPRGQPAEAPFRLALITVLQFLEGLSDRAAADAVRGRIDWKYLLCLELDDPGFDYSILCEFRARLLDNEAAESRLFYKIVSVLKDHKLLKARTRQRTDATHVLAAVRDLGRLEKVIETLRAALNTLATAYPDWVRANIPPEWVDRYWRNSEWNRLPIKDEKIQELADAIGRDGHALLDAIWSDQSLEWMRSLPAVETLRRVWVQSFMTGESGVRWRQPDNTPPSSLRINSPYDPDARYGYKRNRITGWVGYKVHLTETCDEEGPNIITNVHTEPATTTDNNALPKIHKTLSEAELLPDRHLVDAGYVEAQQFVDSQREYGIELLGPPQGNGRWQHDQGTGFDIGHFQINWEQEQVTCPMGKLNSSWKPRVDGRGNDVIHVAFLKSDCAQCTSLSQCTKSNVPRRTLNIKPRELHEALQNARRRLNTQDFKAEYKKRSGIEGTLSQGVRAFGLRRSRYVGMAKTRLQHLATAAAINLARAAAWLEGHTLEKTRCSAFARVMRALPT